VLKSQAKWAGHAGSSARDAEAATPIASASSAMRTIDISGIPPNQASRRRIARLAAQIILLKSEA
jgi:hypothetical protein